MKEEENPRVLIVDDETEWHSFMRKFFGHKYVFYGAIGEVSLKLRLSERTYDLILLDLSFDKANASEKTGFKLLPLIKDDKNNAETPIIIVTKHGEVQYAVEGLKKGAAHFLHKAEDIDFEFWEKHFDENIAVYKNKKENKRLQKENKKLEHEIIKVKEKIIPKNHPEFPLIGISPQIKRIKKLLKAIADEPDVNVLITGETGVGKGIAARFLHHNSPRAHKPFEEVHISAIPKSIVEAQIFGAKKGSYTGSVEDTEGRFKIADKGVLFLDEIGELSMDIQIKLLQFLQDKVIHPIGHKKSITLDVQIVAASNKDLRQEIAAGNFRKDLFHRIKQLEIEIPPLRERREDILPLMIFFLEGVENEKDLDSIMDRDVKVFLINDCPWLGNVRELETDLKTMVFNQRKIEKTDKITMDCIPDDLLKKVNVVSVNTENKTTSQNARDISITIPKGLNPKNIKVSRAISELEDIEKALIRTNGKKQEAAELLGLTSSDNIRTRVLKYKKKFPELVKQFHRICQAYKVK